MKTVQCSRLALLLFLIFVVTFTCSLASSKSESEITPTCIKSERNALLKFKQGLKDPKGQLSSWIGEDCCTWKYVTCNNRTGHVAKLDLRNGVCSIDSSCLGGEISPSLLDLKHLSYLDLSMNYFEGIPIPEFLGSLRELSYLNLSFTYFEGSIPPQLGNLSKLRYLDLHDACTSVLNLHWLSCLSSLEYIDLSYVNLSSASNHWLEALNMLPSLLHVHLTLCELYEIPEFLPNINFSSLSVLEVSYNAFSSSSLPQWVYNLSNIVRLDLSGNALKGNISNFLQRLSLNLKGSLEELNLIGNQFFGEIPDSLGELKKLRELYLEDNSISGQVPESIAMLVNLQELGLSRNQMNGSIPEKINRLTELMFLEIEDNRWEGEITEKHLHSLRKLEGFSISSSDKDFRLNISESWLPPFSLSSINISGLPLGPTLPAWISTQDKLSVIVLTDVGISGEFPKWLWRLSSQIRSLHLSNNHLKGSVPDSIEFHSGASVDLSFNDLEGHFPLWRNVWWLNLANNKLSGTVPGNLHLVMSSLVYLNISGNALSGTIPSSLGQMEPLLYLDMSRNKFSGEIPDAWNHLQNLEILDLSHNNLSGQIPTSIFLLLEWVKLNNNNLSGEFSCPINVTFLLLLDLGDNNLSGNIPKGIGGSFPALSELRLRSNKFNGKIPEQLCDLPQLHILDLALNDLSGPIPECLEKWNGFRTMTSFDPVLSFPSLGLTPLMDLTFKAREVSLTKGLKLANFIDLSSNNLQGEIPKGITSLSCLRSLNLSRNQLVGKIPEDIGELQQLESLDLSCNHFSGRIPPSMSLITSLNFLNLSWNNLSGPIPSTNQFLTFNNPSIYEGNAQLCGDPLQTKCKVLKKMNPADNQLIKDEDDDTADENFGIFISSMSGFVIGFFVTVYSLMLKVSRGNGFTQCFLGMEEIIVVAIYKKMSGPQRLMRRNS